MKQTITGAADCGRIIDEVAGGQLSEFEVDGETHYEVVINGEVYGPMIETEFFWFTHGLKIGV
jgi:hypothetical protein